MSPGQLQNDVVRTELDSSTWDDIKVLIMPTLDGREKQRQPQYKPSINPLTSRPTDVHHKDAPHYRQWHQCGQKQARTQTPGTKYSYRATPTIRTTPLLIRTLQPLPLSKHHNNGARRVHRSSSKAATVTAAPDLAATQAPLPAAAQAEARTPALAVLPLTSVLRTYLITRVSSSPALWGLSTAILRRMASPSIALMDPDRNPVLHWLLRHTFYAQFCAGENKDQVRRTVAAMKDVGFHGIIVESAIEVLPDGREIPGPDSAATRKEIETWKRNMLETVAIAESGAFVALKWSGLGRYALQLLKSNQPPTPEMAEAIHEVCERAAAKNVALLPGAEHETTNEGIDSWTLDLEAQYNRTEPGYALMYNTYQAYLKSTPAKLARHLAAAQKDGYTLGVKLVRGAYLSSEPRNSIWSTKEETDRAYNGLAEALLQRQYGSALKPADDAASKQLPPIAVIIATHNAESVRKVQRLRNEQAAEGRSRVRLAYAQLQGMADEVGCELIKSKKSASLAQETSAYGPLWRKVDIPNAFKCMPWGTTGECLQYLLRRASENKDAATRTEGTRRAMGAELKRRLKAAMWLA
ncbi:uncharacterized protein K452DRAFT_316793 [Aplosporella prunicola CBS 121167]|uniref:Proline dehydrogenase n=1 Tax=Aplosporella prunicola CBS 121167 TaxID=1176127 RepID=A0A6A6BIQ0_9PEZI|nr:uncharacterized protein K452DRAFT_316793 [Aplosporella prunicola CBS 121167]KAF2144022.1 hypothetical protein K452DRAFT_316793 [Aplosporella prunicola CBS 121167]